MVINLQYSLDYKIGQMVMTGFRGTDVDCSSPISRAIKELNLSGVWLTDNESPMQDTIGNIKSPDQLKKLISDIKKYSDVPLFVAIDAEGGKIIRLKEKYGFPKTYSAKYLGQKDNPDFTYNEALKIAKTLKRAGINFNFSPVLDLDLEPNSPALGQKERCFSRDPDKVIRHARQIIKANHSLGILCCLKHFPGHGSTSDDSHDDYVDVSDSWTEKELRPYRYFIDRNMTDAILTAHIMIKQFDDKYPATLSKNIITGILRNKLNYQGVVISDDLNMGAIRLNYSYEDAVELAINAGVDIILNSNVMTYNEDIAQITIETIKKLVKDKYISKSRIDQSFSRIIKLKRGLE